MTEYQGNTPIPGLSDVQSAAVELALRMAEADRHDGICREIASVLGDSGGPFSDQQVTAAIALALIRDSGIGIPTALFANPNVAAAVNQLKAAQSTLDASAALGAELHDMTQRATALLSVGAALEAAATTGT